VLAAAALDRRVPAPARPVLLAAAMWAALGGTSLRAEAAIMSRLLTSGDLAGGRDRLGHLCGRDASGLDGPELARAAIESVAENTADAAVGPLLWGAVLGLPGVVGYRAVNTLDAMVGHRSPRYLRFGWAAARLDDLANLAPARLCAALAALAAPVIGGSPRAAWRVWRRDGDNHPSPNAGQCEAAFAGALDVTLGGTNVYGDEIETRGRLGDGRRPVIADVARCADLSAAVVAGGVVISAVLGALVATARNPGTARDRPGWGAARRRDDLGRGQVGRDRGNLSVARAPGRAGRAVQGAEHVAELVGDGRRRRDRPRAGDAGGRRGCRAGGGDEPGAAQARRRAP
jgi:adenosylcobinamide-phosphate synthase